MDGISKEVYLKARPDIQREMMFDILTAVNNKVDAYGETICKLEKSFQARKVWDKTFAGLTGAIAGFVAGLFR